MRRVLAALVISSLLAFVPEGLAEEEVSVEFHEGAIGGELLAADITWVLLAGWVPEARVALEGVSVPDGLTFYNRTFATTQGDLMGSRLPVHSSSEVTAGSFSGVQADAEGFFSLFLKGQGGQVLIGASQSSLRVYDGDSCLAAIIEERQWNPYLVRQEDKCGSGGVSLAEGGGHVQTESDLAFSFEDVLSIEWLGVRASCDNSPNCVSSGAVRARQFDIPGTEESVGTVDTSHVAFRAQGPAKGSGHFSAIAFGGPSLDLHVDGWVRLPLAEAADPGCGSCFNPENRTVWATGELLLEDLRPVPGRSDRLQTRMSGDVQAFRLDEEYMDPASIFGSKAGFVAAGAAGVAVSWVAWKVAAALVHRLGAEDALTHPRRRRIHEYVHENPGTTFRELSRATGLSAGNLRHHLSILTRTKVLVEHTHRSTVRIFPNHGRYDDNWRSVVFLREKPLADLHAFVKEHDGCSQSDILDHFQALGWSRSTTQHRLLKLEGAGLVETRPRGRRKLYSLASARPPVHTLQVLQRGLEAQS
jgi:predicted transcriptional regulator